MVICRGDGFMHYVGYKKDDATKNVLQIEILDVDEQNKYGETLIYVATYFCEIDVVNQLLNLGANPNIQNMDGNSALHAAAYTGNFKLLNLLVISGGDLRLVNCDGQRPCLLYKDIKNQSRIKLFEQSFFNEFIKHIQIKADPISIPQRKPSIFDNLARISRTGYHNQNRSYFGYQSGFGNYFCQNKSIKGLISSIKVIINSKNLEVDLTAKCTEFSCGYSVKMLSQTWNHYPVSTKIVDSNEMKMFDTKLMELSNQALKEANILGHLRHPNILLLMAINVIIDETEPTVMYQLIFERCHQGSLYNYLQAEKHELPYSNIVVILNQIVDSISFCHSQSIIHCAISSQSIFLVNSMMAKLGNFENSMELKTQENRSRSKCLFQKRNSFNFHNNSDGILYKWLAPEILCENGSIGTSVDVYGMAVLVWEIFTGEIPHTNRSYKTVIHQFSSPFPDSFAYRIPDNLLSLLRLAFTNNPSKRPSFIKFRSLLKELNSNCFKIEDQEYSESSNKIVNTTNSNDTNSVKLISENDKPVPDDHRLNRKSISLHCLTKRLKDSNSWNCGTYATIGNRQWYKDIAALPNHDSPEQEWKYPSPLTEVSFEGRGNLSNETHRKSIVRGMKPASHHTGLSTSQTNICDLIGTQDLIKSSSKGSLNKYIPAESSYTENCSKKRYQMGFPKSPLKPTMCRRFSPLGSKIANLVKKYESSDSHPYSSSNCSTPRNECSSKFDSPPSSLMTNKENVSKYPPSPDFVTGNRKKYFPSLVSRERQDWSSTTENDSMLPAIFKYRAHISSRKPYCFGDVTNKYV